jgi:2-keto-4-pentenoate hydratase/2-oxohepta-3-ene-1,7-dioic acid hydratase in catechol pathway
MNKPGKIVCVGRNYVAHAKELGNEVPAEPLLFLKPPSSVIATGDVILLPAASKQVEYEGEIGIVIGRTVHRASDAEAGAAIGAIVALNDVTARDLQTRDSQWTRAKGFDTFCAIGPPSPAPPPARLGTLEVVTRVNGEERQRGRAADMAFAIPRLIAYISCVMTLEPGDVVATGTPAGVGPLAPGDTVEIEVPGFSVVRNSVRREP